MPARTFHLRESAQKSVQRLPSYIKNRIPEALLSIKQNPIIGEKLHGDLQGYYKYRLGDYRIVYSFNTKTSTVIVVAIEHRQGVYR